MIEDVGKGHPGITLTDADYGLGVLVDAVVHQDLCAQAGLRPGHVITAVDGK